jgi:hypothetical protein
MMIDFDKDWFFWQRVNRENIGCWPWIGAIRQGAGRCEFRGRKTDPRRVAYTLAIGEIPAGRWVTSRCKNRICCRPDHFALKGIRRPKPDFPGFWDFVTKTAECWLWTGPESIEFDGRVQPPWRVAYLLTRRRRVPRRAFIRRTCETAKCVRPDHLAPAWLKSDPNLRLISAQTSTTNHIKQSVSK